MFLKKTTKCKFICYNEIEVNSMTYEDLVKKTMQEEIKFYHDFWKQYIELEKLFLETEKFVAISDKNKSTYSIQYNILLQAICAEVDIVIKRLCYEYDSQAKVKDMKDYIHVITLFDPSIKDIVVNLELYSMVISPWKNIGFRENNGVEQLICPYWWDGYIKLKHRRLTFSKSNNEFNIVERNIQQANQKNVLGALAGLFILETRCLQKMRERFCREFQNNGFSSTTVEICNRFNDSFFQETIETLESF